MLFYLTKRHVLLAKSAWQPVFLNSQCLQVLYGVPRGKEEDAQVLTAGISSGLRGVMGAIDAK